MEKDAKAMVTGRATAGVPLLCVRTSSGCSSPHPNVSNTPPIDYVMNAYCLY
jgi:hypothetical protein